MACSVPGHYLNQCGQLDRKKNKFQWNLNRYTTIFAKENYLKCHLQNGGHFVWLQRIRYVKMCYTTQTRGVGRMGSGGIYRNKLASETIWEWKIWTKRIVFPVYCSKFDRKNFVFSSPSRVVYNVTHCILLVGDFEMNFQLRCYRT